MRKTRHLPIIIYSLTATLICLATLLFLISRQHSEMIYFDMGVAFRIKAVVKALSMLAMLMLPFAVAAYFKENAPLAKRWLASIASLSILLLFPFDYKFNLWQPASSPDGSPIYNLQGERARTTYAGAGYRPLWSASFSVHQPYDDNAEGEDGFRKVSRGNLLWGQYSTYGLNHTDRLGREGQGSGGVYECLLMRTTHILGFYLRDRQGEELTYLPEAKLSGAKCKQIPQPITVVNTGQPLL
jgi:hypothetical protein